MHKYPGHITKRGSKGEAVKVVQSYLNSIGKAHPGHYKHLQVDGEFGPSTQAEVKLFQSRHKVRADGQVGPATWRAMFGPKSVPAQPRPPAGKSHREMAVHHALAFVGVHEIPWGSNSGPHITEWERHTARGGTYLDHAPWCGIFAENMLSYAGVHTTSRMAAVSFIEDDARAHSFCYRGYNPGANFHGALHGDLVIMFGRGIHVEIMESVDHQNGVVHNIGGNTSSGSAGSQSNGGGVYRRTRSFSDVHGVALINYPG